MRNWKKIAGIALALMMLLSLMAPAMAATVTISLPKGETGVSENLEETYTAYKIFDAKLAGENEGQEITNPTGTGSTFDSVTYTIEGDSPFFNTANTFEGLTLAQIDGTNTYSVSVTAGSAFDAAAFAEELLKVVNADGFTQTPVATGKATLTEDATLNLENGYFLIVGSLGSKAILDTVGQKNMNIQTKSSLPTIDKDINAEVPMPDGVGGSIPYKVTINAKPGALGYVLHDTMTTGLSFNDDVVVTAGEKILGLNTDYTVVKDGLADGCTFEVVFAQDYLDGIKADTAIVVTYSATITADAVTVDTLENTAKLAFGNEDKTVETPPKTVETPVYEFDLVKTDKNGKVLEGAKFELYKTETDGEAMKLVLEDDGYYRLATEEDTTTTTEITAGNVTIKGLLAGTYYLEETEAPDGYNKVAGRTLVEITDSNLKATVEDGYYKANVEDDPDTTGVDESFTNSGVQVVNLTGAELPSTGGIGTTIFYVVGGVLAVGAVILLVARKRVSEEQ